MKTPDVSGQPGKKWWRRCLSAGVLTAFVLGIVVTVGSHAALESTNREAFCISCHQNVYEEYQTSRHATNRTGVRAKCADCHLPQAFVPKMLRKMKASKEVWRHYVTKTIDTPEKFEAARPRLAQSEWERMKTSDSQECRNCHDAEAFDFGEQEGRAVDQHSEMKDKGETCIDCHKGLVHQLPPDAATGAEGAAASAAMQ